MDLCDYAVIDKTKYFFVLLKNRGCWSWDMLESYQYRNLMIFFEVFNRLSEQSYV